MKTVLAVFMCLSLAGCAGYDKDVPPAAEAIAEVSPEPAIEPGTIITIKGQLISTICFGDENPEKHDVSLECAVENTQKGIPVAVLEAGKPAADAWILLTVPQIFSDYMGQTVRVTGDVRSQGVLNPTRVEWKKDEDWVFIM